jgi:hypothetical protein
LPSSSIPQRAAPTSNHGHPPRLQRLPTPSRPQPTMKEGARCVSSLPSHVPDAAASTSRSEDPPPRIIEAPRSEEQSPRRHRGHDEIQTRRLQEGSDADGATVARPKWTGLSPLDDSARGDTQRPQQGKRHPQVSPSLGFRPRSPQARTLGQESRPLAIRQCLHRCPTAPQ